MIKLIATDLDGTLLDSKKRVPQELGKLIDALERRGILFVPASGRPMSCLTGLFEGYADRLGFISDNGGMVMVKGKYLKRNILTADEARYILGELMKVEHLIPCIEGVTTAFYESLHPPFVDQIHRFFIKSQHVENIWDSIETEEICKVAAVDYLDAETNGFVKLEHLKADFEVMLSGEGWIDVAVKGTEKGKGFLQMLDMLGIKPEEAMVFGDFLNDATMIAACPNSYAMKNAHPRVKELAAFETAFTNDENGVMRELARVLDLEL